MADNKKKYDQFLIFLGFVVLLLVFSTNAPFSVFFSPGQTPFRTASVYTIFLLFLFLSFVRPRGSR